MSFIKTGDIMMPSAAVTCARFASKHNKGVFGKDLFANTVVDPNKQDSKDIVCYFDSDGDIRRGGNVRTLASGPAWFVDEIIISSSAENSADAVQRLRLHVNFLCSIRNHPVFCEEDQIWYRFIHFALNGRPKRVGRTAGGMQLYEATIRIVWRPMSTQDRDYETITGISLD